MCRKHALSPEQGGAGWAAGAPELWRNLGVGMPGVVGFLKLTFTWQNPSLESLLRMAELKKSHLKLQIISLY